MALQIDIDNSSIIQLRAELKRLKNDLASATDPTQMAELAAEAGRVNDKMSDVNEQVKIFSSGSPFERAKNQLGGVGSALKNLDFEKANARAIALSKSVGGISFKDATAGLKNLGSTFVQLGKSLLTNPLFLLAAVIAAIVFAIIELLKQAGIMKVIMEQVGKVMEVVQIAIDAVVQALKDLADWFGITNNAAEDAAERQANSAQKIADAYEEGSKDIIQGLDNEIKMAKLNGEETEKLERKKLVILALVARKRFEAAQAQLESARLSGKLTAKELEDLEKQVNETRRLYNQAIFNFQYFNSEIKKEKEDAEDNDKKDRAKSAAEARKRAEENRKKELAAIERYEQQRLIIQRKFEDFNASLIEDETERKLELNRLANERALQDLEKQKMAEIKVLEDAGIKGEELEKRRLEIVSEYAKLRTNSEKQYELERNAIIDANDEKIKKEKDKLLENIATIELARRDSFTREIAALDKKEKDELDILQQAYDKGAISKEAFEQKKLELVEYYAGLRGDAVERENKRQEDLQAQELAATIKLYKEKADAAQRYLNKAADFINTLFDIEENVGDESEEAQEARAKKRFEFNKAVNIGNALIQTSLAVATALANPPGPPFSIPQAIGAGIFGAAQVAAIASQPFKSSGGGTRATPPTPVSTPSTPNMQLFPSQPTIPQTQSEIGGGDMSGGGSSDMIVKAYVVESEITKSQNTVNKYQKLSEL